MQYILDVIGSKSLGQEEISISSYYVNGVLNPATVTVEPGVTLSIQYYVYNGSEQPWQLFGYLSEGTPPSDTTIQPSVWYSPATIGVGQTYGPINYGYVVGGTGLQLNINAGHVESGTQYAFIASENPAAGGYITGTSDGQYAEMTTISVTANINTGYVFSNWTSTGITLSNPSAATQSFNMPANAVTLVANFTQQQNTYAFSAMENPPAGGNITGTVDGAYAQGTSISVTANPSAGYNFINWAGSGITGLPSTNPTLSFIMPGNAVSIQANFQVIGGTDCSDPQGTNGGRRCIDGFWATCNNGTWVWDSPPTECPVECEGTGPACIDGYINYCQHGVWSPSTSPCVPSPQTNWLLIGALVAASIVGSAFIIGRK